MKSSRICLLATLALGTGLLAAPPAPAAVPGPNGLIAFGAKTGGHYQIYTLDPSNLNQAQLTNVDGDAIAPHWSPDSRRITFELDTANTCAQVTYMNADGSNLTVLPLANGDICEASPSFSRDGTRIFYEAFDGHRDSIFSMRLDGTDRRWVTSCEGRGVTDPEVSPSGTMLAFTCFQRRGAALFVSSIDGSHLHELTPFSFGVGVHEDWAPDSGHIVFISTHDEGAPDAQVNSATIRPDGSDLRWLTSYPPGGLRAFANSYSPEGDWIVMRIEDGDQNALYLIHPDGSGLQQLTPFSSFRPRFMVWGSAS
jgi:Tol biopolymer transport system component